MAEKINLPGMSRNVEIKAHCRDLERQLHLARELSDRDAEMLEQTDLYFRTRRGRLKLREIHGQPAELIYYERRDAGEPTESCYLIARVPDPERVGRILDAALETIARVQKQRRLFHVGQTRVHFDRVEGLGDFIELEVVLLENQTVADGEATARDLMSRLGIGKDDLVAEGYLDLAKDGNSRR